MTSPLMPGVFPFGTLPDGQDVKLIILSNDLMSVGILTQGAILQDLRIAAVPWSMTIGSDDLAPYLSDMRSAGAVIGPVINRISGGQATLNDRVFEFERNQDGKHTRHSGSAGTNRKLWDLTEVNDTSCTLELSLADGEGGFPGNRAVAVRFRLLPPMTLELRIAATTDADTWINFANHSYWTLDGTDRIDGHELWINAEKYCVADDQDLVTGEVLPVEGTGYDFRQGQVFTPGQTVKLDTNYCLAKKRRALTEVLRLRGTKGVEMRLETTEPGLQLYDGGKLKDCGAELHENRRLCAYAGLAIEPQGWPDAPNQPHFPTTLVQAGAGYEQINRFHFTAP